MSNQYEPLDKQDLTGRTVLLSSDVYHGSEEDRRFKCEAGFGCKSFTSGQAVIGHYVGGKLDGVKARVERYEVDKVEVQEEQTDGQV